jgi:hypothetical protein
MVRSFSLLRGPQRLCFDIDDSTSAHPACDSIPSASWAAADIQAVVLVVRALVSKRVSEPLSQPVQRVDAVWSGSDFAWRGASFQPVPQLVCWPSPQQQPYRLLRAQLWPEDRRSRRRRAKAAQDEPLKRIQGRTADVPAISQSPGGASRGVQTFCGTPSEL